MAPASALGKAQAFYRVLLDALKQEPGMDLAAFRVGRREWEANVMRLMPANSLPAVRDYTRLMEAHGMIRVGPQGVRVLDPPDPEAPFEDEPKSPPENV